LGGAGGRGGSAGTAGSGGSGIAGAGGAGATVIAATPPMGWNSWNTFQCNISESLIEATADAMVSSGMQAAGYQYVNLDDCWMNGRDSSGNLQWNASKFPSGIPALAAYVHGKGLKIGIYETPNTETCVGIYGGISPSVAVGSLGHETADAKTFASWGIDFLKYDLCQGQRSDFATMRDALRASGRSIVYSINPGNGADDVCPPNTCSLNLVSIANMWRIGFDINASWTSVISLVDQDAALSSYAGPGHWNDPDMLEVGNGLAANEDQSHFSMWAMLAAPLLAGNDIRSMSSATRAVLTNTDVIAVDQDPLGAQGKLVATPATNLQVWSKTLSGTNARAVALLNRTSGSASIAVQWTTLGLPAGSASVRDLWSHTDLGTIADGYTVTAIPSHGVVMLKVVSSP
jgi:alpha-galactosidase